jgi:septum site-determining protein MinD
MAGMELPAKAIREQIANAVDLIVQISRLPDGSRRVMSITEIVGMQGEGVTRQEIYRFKEGPPDKNRKITGEFLATGFIPTFIEDFEKRGVRIPRALFGGVPNAAGPGTISGTGSGAPPKASGGGR